VLTTTSLSPPWLLLQAVLCFSSSPLHPYKHCRDMSVHRAILFLKKKSSKMHHSPQSQTRLLNDICTTELVPVRRRGCMLLLGSPTVTCTNKAGAVRDDQAVAWSACKRPDTSLCTAVRCGGCSEQHDCAFNAEEARQRSVWDLTQCTHVYEIAETSRSGGIVHVVKRQHTCIMVSLTSSQTQLTIEHEKCVGAPQNVVKSRQGTRMPRS
jgi:hypothetical protein